MVATLELKKEREGELQRGRAIERESCREGELRRGSTTERRAIERERAPESDSSTDMESYIEGELHSYGSCYTLRCI